MPSPKRLDLSKLTTREFPFIKKLSREQEDMVVKFFKYRRIIVDAIPGSGKTVILTQALMALKNEGIIDKIYYVVFPVQEDSLGFLPGDVDNKIKEYIVPFVQALIKAGANPQHLDIHRMTDSYEDYEYKVVPHTFLRGRTIEGVGAIIDEAQNGTGKELKKTFTRFEDDCYVAIAGHTGQTDIPESQSGFLPYIDYFKHGKLSGAFTRIEFAHLTENFRGDFSNFTDNFPG